MKPTIDAGETASNLGKNALKSLSFTTVQQGWEIRIFSLYPHGDGPITYTACTRRGSLEINTPIATTAAQALDDARAAADGHDTVLRSWGLL